MANKFSLSADLKDIKLLKKSMQNYITVGERASSIAIKRETMSLKTALRNDVKRAGLGEGVANAWRSITYPEGNKLSVDAAGFLWTKAPNLIKGYSEGGLIRAKSGTYLAIPTDNVPRRGGFRGKRLTPEKWPRRLGKLRFVPLKNGNAMYVVDKVGVKQGRKTRGKGFYNARGIKTTSRGIYATQVVMFILVRQVKLKKKLDVTRITAGVTNRLADRLYEERRRLLK
jgi:hypothetical protein